ncbi:uncharacterized protein LOC135461425 isoform X2 [Liolophura sinensis]|uniref:uncharacterized protein LOC135461425 isoform X2 n=1 Tax=Liolophura sinensis TaxID=3198878 RepID=UPI003158502E
MVCSGFDSGYCRFVLDNFVVSCLERYKQELDETKLAQLKAYTDLRTAREKAVCFEPAGRKPSMPLLPSQGCTSVRPHQWYKPDDLHHASEINRIGLNSRQSYNYDRYRTRPPVHKYALVGDIMRPGMDFTGRNDEESAKSSMKWSTQANASRTTRSQTAAPTFSSQKCVVDLPVNIKHFFGTKVCDSLLSDQRVVNDTLTQQKRDKEAMARPSGRHNVSPIDPGICPSYEALGNSSRQNIFPGYSIYHKKSLAKSVYTDDVHRHRDPPPDKYRYQRDELSTWAEHNVLRERMKKSWDQYLAQLSGKAQS